MSTEKIHNSVLKCNMNYYNQNVGGKDQGFEDESDDERPGGVQCAQQ
jgi:hypothetical protein